MIRQREDGNKRWTSLRTDDLQAWLPGILDAIMAAYEQNLPAHPKPAARKCGLTCA